jgi:hypothetical protein
MPLERAVFHQAAVYPTKAPSVLVIMRRLDGNYIKHETLFENP